MNLRILFVAHGIITLAAGILLVVAPSVIPDTVGIPIVQNTYFLCYLLAASELCLSFLSLGALRITDVKALKLIVLTNIILHTSSGVLEIVAYTRGLSAAIWANVALRIIVSLLFWYYGLHKPLKAI